MVRNNDVPVQLLVLGSHASAAPFGTPSHSSTAPGRLIPSGYIVTMQYKIGRFFI